MNPGLMNTEDAVLIYVHVPKAGGTTLHAVLERAYAPAVSCRCDLQRPGDVQRFLDMPVEARARLRCLRGHLPFGLHTRLPQQPIYITLLRDPVARFLSQYSHCRRNPENARRLGYPPERVRTLEDYVDLEIERGGINFQTRFLCGAFDLKQLEAPYPPLPADALRQACAHVDRYFLVAGLTDRFAEFLALLRRRLGWRVCGYTRRNVDPTGGVAGTVNPATLARIEALHAADRALVAYVCERFSRQVLAEGADFAAEVARLRRWDAVSSGVQRLYNAPPVRRLRAAVRAATRAAVPKNNAGGESKPSPPSGVRRSGLI